MKKLLSGTAVGLALLAAALPVQAQAQTVSDDGTAADEDRSAEPADGQLGEIIVTAKAR